MLDLIAHVLVFGSLTCGLLFLEDWLTANNPHRSFWYGRLRENIIREYEQDRQIGLQREIQELGNP